MRVIIADDAPLLRSVYSEALTAAGIEVVAEAATAAELIAQVRKHRPDVALVDISFGGRGTDGHDDDGITAAEQLRHDYPTLGLLIFSVHMRPVYLARILDIGEDHIGFLGKDRVSDFSTVVRALRCVAAGGTSIDEILWRQMLEHRRARDELSVLPRHQREVLKLLARGLSNRAIADQLKVQEGTIEGYLSHVFSFLQIPETRDVNKRVCAVLDWLRRTGSLPELAS